MIKSITVTNHLGNSVELSLTNPWDTGLVITSITGLGPPKATINSTDLAMGDGAAYNSARIDKRNIVFNFQLVEALDSDGKVIKTVEQVRLDTYRYFPDKKKVNLIFETDTRYGEIEGYVESNEPDIFQQKETQQISIICPFPFFKSNLAPIALNGVEGEFELPFSNESLTEPLINFGEIVGDMGSSIYYDGDVEAGVVITMKIFGETRGITMVNTTSRERMYFDTGRIQALTGDSESDLKAGDIVTISTIDGDKYARLRRGGVPYNIISCFAKETDWLHLVAGVNKFSYGAEFGFDSMSVEIKGNNLYAGI